MGASQSQQIGLPYVAASNMAATNMVSMQNISTA